MSILAALLGMSSAGVAMASTKDRLPLALALTLFGVNGFVLSWVIA